MELSKSEVPDEEEVGSAKVQIRTVDSQKITATEMIAALEHVLSRLSTIWHLNNVHDYEILLE